jgi:hypothetical protein
MFVRGRLNVSDALPEERRPSLTRWIGAHVWSDLRVRFLPYIFVFSYNRLCVWYIFKFCRIRSVANDEFNLNIFSMAYLFWNEVAVSGCHTFVMLVYCILHLPWKRECIIVSQWRGRAFLRSRSLATAVSLAPQFLVWADVPQYCYVFLVSVTNNSGLWIRWIDLLDTHKSQLQIIITL